MSNLNFLGELAKRELLCRCTDYDTAEKQLNGESTAIGIYISADYDSLHIGHLPLLSLIRMLHEAGHKPVLLVGRGTAAEGRLLSCEEAAENAERISAMLTLLTRNYGSKVINDSDLVCECSFDLLMREFGVYFPIKQFIEGRRGGIMPDMNELWYSLARACGMYCLYEDYGCRIFADCDSGWRNLKCDLGTIQKKSGDGLSGITVESITGHNGIMPNRIGYSIIWLDPQKTSPYNFYQFWRNTADTDVIRYIKQLTDQTSEEIRDYSKLKENEINAVKEVLAYELTKAIHGEAAAAKAIGTSRRLFISGITDEYLPTTVLTAKDFDDGLISAVKLLIISGLAVSASEAQRLIIEDAVSLDDIPVTAPDEMCDISYFSDPVLLRKGKKHYHRFIAGK